MKRKNQTKPCIAWNGLSDYGLHQLEKFLLKLINPTKEECHCKEETRVMHWYLVQKAWVISIDLALRYDKGKILQTYKTMKAILVDKR